jgi:hypothetical protein
MSARVFQGDEVRGRKEGGMNGWICLWPIFADAAALFAKYEPQRTFRQFRRPTATIGQRHHSQRNRARRRQASRRARRTA